MGFKSNTGNWCNLKNRKERYSVKLFKTKQVEMTNSPSGKDGYRQPPLAKMEAIASGVQARLEESTSFSTRVTDETVRTAQALGLANSVIERWSAERLYRLTQQAKRLSEIRSLLDTVYRERPGAAG